MNIVADNGGSKERHWIKIMINNEASKISKIIFWFVEILTRGNVPYVSTKGSVAAPQAARFVMAATAN